MVITFLVQTAVFAVRPIISYRALALGASPFAFGFVASSFALFSLVAAVPAGRWIDRWGERAFITLGSAMLAVTCAALLWGNSIPLLAFTQAVLGLGHLLNVVGSQSAIAGTRSGKAQDDRYGLFTVAISLGQLVAPAVAGVLAGQVAASLFGAGTEHGVSAGGARLVFATAAVAAALSIPVALGLPDPMRRHGSAGNRTDSAGTGVLGILAQPGMAQAMLASMAVLSSIDVLVAYLPAYGEAHRISVQRVGMLLSIRSGFSLLSRLAMAWMVERVGRFRLLILSMGTPALALVALPLFTDFWALVMFMALAGYGLGLGQPLTLAWVAAQAPRTARATALGLRVSGNRLGQLIAPSVVGLLSGALGLPAIFWTLSLLLGSGAALVLTAAIPDEAGAEP